jgi:hypothetical protein
MVRKKMKYAHIEQNKLLGWYADDIHNSIPINCIEVEDKIWQEALSINANCYENGKFIFKDFRTGKELEEERILTIKAKAFEIINSRYTDIQQRNILMSQDADEISKMNIFILGIRAISNLAETNKTAVEQIDWEIEWEYANEVLRTNQLIPAMQDALNLTSEQVDTMFLEASKL